VSGGSGRHRSRMARAPGTSSRFLRTVPSWPRQLGPRVGRHFIGRARRARVVSGGSRVAREWWLGSRRVESRSCSRLLDRGTARAWPAHPGRALASSEPCPRGPVSWACVIVHFIGRARRARVVSGGSRVAREWWLGSRRVESRSCTSFRQRDHGRLRVTQAHQGTLPEPRAATPSSGGLWCGKR
jgi:hypothetical protein